MSTTSMRPKISISWASVADVSAIVDLLQAVFPHDDQDEIAEFVKTMPNKHVRVAKVENQVVGIFTYSYEKNNSVKIDKIAVLREFRRLGIGTRFLDGLLVALTAAPTRLIVIEVPEPYLEAQLFIRDCRTKEGRFTFVYEEGSDVYRFTLDRNGVKTC